MNVKVVVAIFLIGAASVCAQAQDLSVPRVSTDDAQKVVAIICGVLMLTGCRRDEIGHLLWSEIDLDAGAITIPATRTKNHHQHVVPLTDAALTILQAIPRRDRDYVFGRGQGGYSGWSRSKAALDAAAKLKEWTLHDLRRTVRTGLGRLGVAPHIAEAVLNHLPAKLIRTYDRNTYENEKRAALDAWANHIRVALAQASGANVTTLPRSKPIPA
jgi:integrase